MRMTRNSRPLRRLSTLLTHRAQLEAEIAWYQALDARIAAERADRRAELDACQRAIDKILQAATAQVTPRIDVAALWAPLGHPMEGSQVLGADTFDDTALPEIVPGEDEHIATYHPGNGEPRAPFIIKEDG